MDLQNFNNSNQTITSREIADLTGKRHDNVLRDCEKLNESYSKLGLLKIEEGFYILESTGKQQHREMRLSKMQSMDLMTGYKIELRIKVNRRWEELENTQQQFLVPQTYSEALKLASMQAEKLEIQDQQIKKMLPRSEFVDVVFSTDKLLQGSEVCKLLNLPFGNVTLYKRLREDGIFFKDKNEPMQRYVDAGYFRLKEEYVPNLENFIIRAYFTQKGLGFIAKKFNALQSFALLQNPQI